MHRCSLCSRQLHLPLFLGSDSDARIVQVELGGQGITLEFYSTDPLMFKVMSTVRDSPSMIAFQLQLKATRLPRHVLLASVVLINPSSQSPTMIVCVPKPKVHQRSVWSSVETSKAVRDGLSMLFTL